MSSFIKSFSQSLLVIVLVLGVVVTLNILSHKYSVRWDITDEKEYTLSKATTKILDRLEDRLTIKLYYSKQLPPMILPIKERVDDIIAEYQAHAKTPFVIEQVDPDLNEEVERETQELGIAPLQLNVIERDKREVRKVYMGMALYYRDKRQVIPVVTQVQNMEYLMDLSILHITQKEKPKIGVYVGARQSNFRLVDEVVKQMGQLVPIEPQMKDLASLNLKTFVIVHPHEVEPSFLKQWDELVAAGTNLMIFTGNIDVGEDLRADSHDSGIEEWLAKKGLGLSHQVLLDVKQNQQAGFNTGFVQVYLPYPFWVKTFNKDLDNENIITSGLEEILFPWTNVLQLLNDADNPWQAKVLAQSSKSSFLQPEDAPNLDPQYTNEMEAMPNLKQHPLAVVLAQRSMGQEGEQRPGQIFVSATHHMLLDNFLQQNQGNLIFLNNMLESTSWGNFLIDVRSRGKTARPLVDLSGVQKSQIKWGLTVSVPLLAIGLGLLALWFIKRRRLRLIAAL